MKLSTSEFCRLFKVNYDLLKKLIQRNQFSLRFPQYEIQREADKIFFVLKVISKAEYINPRQWSFDTKIAVDDLIKDGKSAGEIARIMNLNYKCVYDYVKHPERFMRTKRADTGKIRHLSLDKIEEVKPVFEQVLMSNAQFNVRLAREIAKQNIGIQIPQRAAYRWGDELKLTHLQMHYFKKAVNDHTPFLRRDLWGDYEFMECVVCDVKKIDDNVLDDDGKMVSCYAVMCIDAKTRYPLDVQFTKRSVTSDDVKRGMLNLILNFGLPKTWLLDNGKEYNADHVLKFLKILYATNFEKTIKIILNDEQDHIINSIPYHPQSKPIERIFRIIKDECSAFSESYSPNMDDSRKPGLKLSYVTPTRTLNELAEEYRKFLYGNYLTRERGMFLHPDYSSRHKIQQGRPKTVHEAFDIAYANYTPIKVDSFTLARSYVDKRQITYRRGYLSFIYKVSLERLTFIPLDPESVMRYAGKKLEVLIDPMNVYHGWLFNLDGELLCEARDLRYDDAGRLNKNYANEIGKVKRKIIKLNKDKIKEIEKLEKIKPVKIFQEPTEMGIQYQTLNINEAMNERLAERPKEAYDDDDYDLNHCSEEKLEELVALLDENESIIINKKIGRNK